MIASREAAGKELAPRISEFTNNAAVVYGITRGGVVVADVLARELGQPMDCLVVQRVPSSMRDVAGGAIAENEVTITRFGNITDGALEAVRQNVAKQKERFRGDNPLISAEGKTAIVVDDGMATGHSMQAAVRYVKAMRAKEIIAVAPVASQEAINLVSTEGEDVRVVTLEDPADFKDCVGRHYQSFNPVTEDEVVEILARARERKMAADTKTKFYESVLISTGTVATAGLAVVLERQSNIADYKMYLAAALALVAAGFSGGSFVHYLQAHRQARELS